MRSEQCCNLSCRWRRYSSCGRTWSHATCAKGTPLNRKTPIGRAIIDRQAIHVHDLLAEVDTEFPDSKAIQKITGTRTSLSTPLLLKGISIGAIHVRRNEVRPFTERQIKLLETFADQAVIAIENLRLFQELTQKPQSSKHPTRNFAKHSNSRLPRVKSWA